MNKNRLRTSISYAAIFSLIIFNVSVSCVFAQNADIKPLVNIKTKAPALQNAVNSLINGEVLVGNKVYKAKITKNYTEIDSLIDQKRFQEAKAMCDARLNADPSDTKARALLGDIYSKQYKLDAAKAEYLKILEKNPNDATAHNGLGNFYYEKTTSSNMDVIKSTNSYYQQALKEFNKAIKLDPDFYKAYNNAGKIMQETGKLAEAEKYYRKALEIEPKCSEAVDNLGTVLYAKNQTDASINKFKEAIGLNSKNSSAYYHLGEALVSRGDYNSAINYLQTALYLNPNSAPVHDMLGKAYQKQGNEAAAIVEYRKSSMIKPEYSCPYLRLANIYQDRGDDEMAIAELKSAVSINPDFQEGKLKIADISLKSDKIDQAIKYYRELLGNKDYEDQALKGLSKAYFMEAQEVSANASITSESEYVDAENAIKQAIQLNPDDLQLYLALLRISRLTNKDGQADFYLNKIIDNPVNKPAAHIVKGEAYIAYKKYNDAQNEFRQALSQVDKIDSILYLGEIFITNRQYPAAKEAFNKVLSKDPGNQKAARSLERIQMNEEQAVAKFNLAKGFYNEGQILASIEAFRDCLALNPYLADAQLLLAKSFEKEKYYFNAIENYTAYVNIANINNKDSAKYNEKIAQLTRKIKNLQEKGKSVKKF